jgi:parvulin-like peptidyl-prolyl isomerase
MANPRENKPVLHTKKHMARLERERRQTRLILAAFIGILVIAAAVIVYGYIDIKYLQVRRPVARVGEVAIPIGEWQAMVRVERSQLINQLQAYQQYAQLLGMDFSAQQQQTLSQLNSSTTLGKSVLDQMIDAELIRQESGKRGIVATTPEVDQAVQASFQFFPSGTPTPTITPTPVHPPTLSPETLALVTLTPTPTPYQTPTNTPIATLDPRASPTSTASPSATPAAGPSATPEPSSTPFPTSTPYTQQGFEDRYKQSEDQLVNEGLTPAQVRELFVSSVLRQKLFEQITANVPHTEEQVWARHILVADEVTANSVRQRLINGEDFAKVAADVSTDTGTKDNGGDLGWFARGKMVPEFETAAFGLKVGEISQPVKSQFGYHIIQVLAHENMPLDAAAYDQAQQTAFDAWLTQARAEYKVVTYDNWQNIVPTDPPVPATLQQ